MKILIERLFEQQQHNGFWRNHSETSGLRRCRPCPTGWCSTAGWLTSPTTVFSAFLFRLWPQNLLFLCIYNVFPVTEFPPLVSPSSFYRQCNWLHCLISSLYQNVWCEPIEVENPVLECLSRNISCPCSAQWPHRNRVFVAPSAFQMSFVCHLVVFHSPNVPTATFFHLKLLSA